MVDKRKDYWHMTKSFSIGTLVTITVLIISQIYAYGKSSQKLEALEVKVVDANKDRIHKTTVEQMFANKDIQLKALSKEVKDVKDSLKDNQKLLREILREMPRRSTPTP